MIRGGGRGATELIGRSAAWSAMVRAFSSAADSCRLPSADIGGSGVCLLYIAAGKGVDPDPDFDLKAPCAAYWARRRALSSVLERMLSCVIPPGEAPQRPTPDAALAALAARACAFKALA